MVGRKHAVAERQLTWRSVDHHPTLELNQLHLWLASPEDMWRMVNSAELTNLLVEREHRRAEQIIDVDKRNLYVGGRVGIRKLLSDYTGFNGQELEFGYGDRGKPRLLNKLDQGELEFNYTVSAGYAFFGFAWGKKLGVDLEVFPRSVDTEAFAKRIMTNAEKETWGKTPNAHHNNAMLCCWTRKEAYGKLLGVGIRYKMNMANLFTNLCRDNWSTAVTGLFDDELFSVGRRVFGIQIGLPISGAAALMYEHESSNVIDHSEFHEPELNAFMLSNLLWKN